MAKCIHVIINPGAGGDKTVLPVLNKVFRENGIEWDVSLTKQSGDAIAQARNAASSGVDTVAVYGGDGTVSEAARGLYGTNVPLAILPGGTANVIAQALGVPLDLVAACSLVCGLELGKATLRAVDMGMANDLPFLIAVGMGFPAVIAQDAGREQKDRFGFFAYALSTIQALRNAHVASYHMTLDGEEVEREGVACLIANSGCFGVSGVSLKTDIDMSDGFLDVIVIPHATLGALLSAAASAVRQREVAPSAEHWRAQEIAVTSEPAQTAQADGEDLPSSQLSVHVLPQAVRFVVPVREGGAAVCPGPLPAQSDRDGKTKS